MKCCSLQQKDLDYHYKRMFFLFYKLDGFNNPTLKHVFIAFFPKELQPELQRQINVNHLNVASMSLGKIYQLTVNCLARLCEQKEFFKDLMKNKQPFKATCKKPYLKIKCNSNKDCTCSPSKKKVHFSRYGHKSKSSSSKHRKPYRFFKKKDSSRMHRTKNSKCLICKKYIHFARDCPNKSAKVVRLIQHLEKASILSDSYDVESVFTEQEAHDEDTTFALNEVTSDDDTISVINAVQTTSPSKIPIPSVRIHILSFKFAKPLPAIGFIDNGSKKSMIHHDILHYHC